jgi:hypothetical protein
MYITTSLIQQRSPVAHYTMRGWNPACTQIGWNPVSTLIIGTCATYREWYLPPPREDGTCLHPNRMEPASIQKGWNLPPRREEGTCLHPKMELAFTKIGWNLRPKKRM